MNDSHAKRVELYISFLYLQGSSIEGGKIYDYPDAHGDIEKLKAACLDTYHCAGFNVKENTLMSEVKQMKGDQPSDVIAYTRNYK